MPAALIGAYHVDTAGEALATRPLAGLALAEHQARRAADAGFSPLLFLTDTPSAALAAAVGRLRHDGFTVEIADGLATTSDRLGLDTPVLLLADGILPSAALLERLAGASASLLVTVPDTPENARYERIDADARWAGVAIADGRCVAETAAMLGGWDPISTLLRRLVQGDSARLAAEDPAPLLLAETADLAAAERGFVRATRLEGRDWIEHKLFTPIEEQALPRLLAHQAEPRLLSAAAATLTLVAGLVALAGLRWSALLALMVAAPLTCTARRLARVQARAIPHLRRYGWAERSGAGLAALGLGWSLRTETGQWGWTLAAALLVGALVALAAERSHVGARWLARRATLPWFLFPLVVLLGWKIALAAITAYACLSFAAAQRERLR